MARSMKAFFAHLVLLWAISACSGASTAAFNPSAGEKTRFVFIVSEAATLNVSVKNDSNDLIRNLIVNAPYPAGTLSILWDGKNNSGELAASGNIYHISVVAVDETGNQAEASGGDCTVLPADHPAVTALAETPDPFYPGAGNIVFSYQLSVAQSVPVTIAIKNAGGSVIRSITLDPQGTGAQTAAWDGKTLVRRWSRDFEAAVVTYSVESTPTAQRPSSWWSFRQVTTLPVPAPTKAVP